MGNPARDLAEIFEKWLTVPPRQSVIVARGGESSPGSREFWASQVRAAELLGEVDRVLQAMAARGRSVQHFQRAQVAWARGVFAPDVNWGTSSQSQHTVITQNSVDMLYGLADVIDSTQVEFELSPETRTTMEGALDDIVELLSSDDIRLGESAKRYVFELVMSIRAVLGESSVTGDVSLLPRINELFGYLTLLAEHLERDERSAPFAAKLREATRRVLPYLKFSSGFVTGVISAAADIQSITS